MGYFNIFTKGLVAVKNTVDTDSSPQDQLDYAEFIYSSDATITGKYTNKAGVVASNSAGLEAYLQAKINGNGTTGGGTITFASGKYYGVYIRLTGNSTLSRISPLKIIGDGDVKWGSGSSNNLPILNLSKKACVHIENIEFNPQGNNPAIKTSVAPYFFRGVFTPNLGALNSIASVSITQGSVGQGGNISNLVAFDPNGTGSGFAGTYDGTAVTITNNGSNYSTDTQIYQTDGFAPIPSSQYDACRDSTFRNLRIIPTTTHTGYAMELWSVFESQFNNIDIINTNKGVLIGAELNTFNNGNCTFDTVRFQGESNTSSSTVGLHFHNPTSGTGQGQVNLLTFNNLTLFSTNGGTAILSNGSHNTNSQDINIGAVGNWEGFDKVVDIQAGNKITIDAGYCIVKPNGTHIRFWKKANSNTIKNYVCAINSYAGNPNVVLFRDDASTPNNQNTVNKLDIIASTATMATVQELGSANHNTNIEQVSVKVADSNGFENVTATNQLVSLLPARFRPNYRKTQSRQSAITQAQTNTVVQFSDLQFRYSANTTSGNLDVQSMTGSAVQLWWFSQEHYADSVLSADFLGDALATATAGAWFTLNAQGAGASEWLKYEIFTANSSYRITIMNFQDTTIHLIAEKLT
jgi:hypothetical protein